MSQVADSASDRSDRPDRPDRADVRLVDEARHRLLDRISSGTLRPGDKLGTERDLAAQLSVSRSTLRQVLAQRPDRPDAQAALAMALARRADELRRDGRSDEAAALVSESESLLRKSR